MIRNKIEISDFDSSKYTRNEVQIRHAITEFAMTMFLTTLNMALIFVQFSLSLADLCYRKEIDCVEKKKQRLIELKPIFL